MPCGQCFRSDRQILADICGKQEFVLKKEIIEAEVLTNEEIAPGIFHMSMRAGRDAVEAACPGQFLNIYPESGGRLVLPRPFGICGADPEEQTFEIVYEVVGSGTFRLSEKRSGDALKICAPLGRGFDLSKMKELQAEDPRPPVLVAGGVGCAPILFLAGELKKMEVPAVAVLGFRETPFLTEKFRETGCRTLVTSEVLNDRTFLGTVIDCMEIHELKAPAYFACGPRGMLAAVDRYVSEDCGDECLQVSLEERMGCGYGVCVGCSVRIREKDGEEKEYTVRRRVCVDGPVFRGSEVIWHD